ncbi:hypothetical protein AX16_008986 [Volvariella volvacea WC 439]|nr:hypothetical protein AX16_008986 [Volvariella volvacea WC 439]
MTTKNILHPRNALRLISSTKKGTDFEERSLQLLQTHMSMKLERVGGKSDGGIDLQGWWWLPIQKHQHQHHIKNDSPSMELDELERRRFRVLAQCKAEQTKLGPKYVREMEGVALRHQARISTPDITSLSTQGNSPSATLPSSCNVPIVAMLISESAFTKAALQHVQSSPVPFFLLHLPPLPTSNPHPADPSTAIRAAFWNPALAAKHGLLGGDFEIRWEFSMKALSLPQLPTGRDQLSSSAYRYADGLNPGPGTPTLWMNNRRVDHWVPAVSG